MSLLISTEAEEKALEIVTLAGRKIATQDDYEFAVKLTKGIKELSKEIEGAFSGAIDAAHKSWKASLAARDKYLDPLKEADGIVRRSMSAWMTAQEKAKREAQLKAIAEAKAQEAALKSFGIEETVVPQVVEAPKVSGVGQLEKWSAKVIDKSMVPMEYLEVNMSALNELARKTKGSLQVPGVIFESEIVAVIR